jgi:small subunit ribosomal protein S18
VDKITFIDYKDAGRLRRYVTDRGKIEPRRKTGTCAKHQRAVTLAIKRARHVALLPFSASHARAIPGAPTSYRDRQERQLTENAQRAEAATASPPDGDGRPAADAPVSPSPDGSTEAAAADVAQQPASENGVASGGGAEPQAEGAEAAPATSDEPA